MIKGLRKCLTIPLINQVIDNNMKLDQSKVDKYGRKNKSRNNNEMKQFYELEEENDEKKLEYYNISLQTIKQNNLIKLLFSQRRN